MAIGNHGEYITAGEYREYLDRYAAQHRLSVRRAAVKSIHWLPQSRDFGSLFSVRFDESDLQGHYSVIVMATGIFGHPVLANIPGLSPDARGSDLQVIHSRYWQGPQEFAGTRVLVVGAGMSGVEIAEQFAEVGMRVSISTRHKVRLWRRRVLGVDVHHIAHLVSHRLPRWITGSYCYRIPALGAFDRGYRGHVRSGLIRPCGKVQRCDGNQATFRDGSQEVFDAVILATGYRWHPECFLAAVDIGAAGQPLADQGKSRSWPSLYFMGAPCGRSLPSEFLHVVNHDAPAIAKAIRKRLS